MDRININIGGLTAAAVLAALYNAARPQGMGFLQYQPGDITEEKAATLLDKERATTYFDYLAGRVMKLNIPHRIDPHTTVDARLYDRDNGAGATELVIASLRAYNLPSNPVIARLHQSGVADAARIAREEMSRDVEQTVEDRVATFRIGLADVADRLAPAVDAATKTEET